MAEEHPAMKDFKVAAETLKNDVANLMADNKKSVSEIKTQGKENSETIIKINSSIDGIKTTFETQEKKYITDIKALEKTISNIKVIDNAKDISINIKHFNQILKNNGKEPIAIENVSEIKSAFDKYITLGERRMSDNEKKFINTIIDSDGGFLVVPEYRNSIEAKEFDSHGFMGAVDTVTIGASEYKIIVDWEDYDESYYENELSESSYTDNQDFKEVTINATQQIYSKKLSRTALEDSMINVEPYVLQKMRSGMVRKDGNNLINGTGVDQPRGALTFADGSTYGTVERVLGETETGKIGWIEVLQILPAALNDDYHANASYVMPRAAFFGILADKSGADSFQIGTQINFFDRSGVSMRLLGYPVVWESSMPAVAAASLSIMFGDMKRFYTYVKRLGVSIIRDETKPQYILLHLRQRTGGNVINFEAVKICVTKS